MTIFGGCILYLSLAAFSIGLISFAKPLRFMRIRTRKGGLLVIGLGFLLFLAGVYLPVFETRVVSPRTHLDEFAPVYQFGEFHSVTVAAPKERVDAAMRAVTPREIRYFQTLMRIRGLALPPEDDPILKSFTSGSFHLMADEPGREIVFASDGRIAKIAMNFTIAEVDSGHSRLTTETRVYAKGWNATYGFAAYWRMIYPGSSLIRRMWLKAIKARAEAPSARSL